MAAPTPQASILIVTKNRRDNVRLAVSTSLIQTAPCEILVFDDASTDGTSEMIRSDFPQVRLHVVEQSVGYIIHRNRGIEIASAPIVVVIDDDTAFESQDTVATSLAEFNDPAIGALAIPFINHGLSENPIQKAPDTNHIWVTHKFTGAAHEIRREAFLKIGGYRTELVHFGEEADLCARLLQAGFVTRLGSAVPARHYLSPLRNYPRDRYYAARSGIISSYMNLPGPLVAPALLGWTARELRFLLSRLYAWPTVKGLAAGYRDIIRHANKRQALSRPVHDLLRELKNEGPMTLPDVRNRLPGIVR